MQPAIQPPRKGEGIIRCSCGAFGHCLRKERRLRCGVLQKLQIQRDQAVIRRVQGMGQQLVGRLVGFQKLETALNKGLCRQKPKRGNPGGGIFVHKLQKNCATGFDIRFERHLRCCQKQPVLVVRREVGKFLACEIQRLLDVSFVLEKPHLNDGFSGRVVLLHLIHRRLGDDGVVSLDGLLGQCEQFLCGRLLFQHELL